MKIVSFNINSIRARPHQLIHLRDTINPDVIGIQETKVDDPEFPINEINEIGYHPEFWGQKGHYGVAILSKRKPENVQKGFESDSEDDQKRFIQATFKWKKQKITIMNGYFPQGENRSHETKFPKKIKFYNDLEKHIKKLKKTEENLIVMGDFNVAPTDLDIGIGEQNVKSGANEVYVFITHAVLSGDAVKKIQKSKIKKLIITDTIDNDKKIKNNNKIQVLSIASLMSEAIKRIANSNSVSDLFN